MSTDKSIIKRIPKKKRILFSEFDEGDYILIIKLDPTKIMKNISSDQQTDITDTISEMID